MTDPREPKFRQVPLASFNYRHEAEFAAGFLKEAGIPYRLQIDDPTLGLSVANAATLWVSAADERRAREVLDEDLSALDDRDESWALADADELELPAAPDPTGALGLPVPGGLSESDTLPPAPLPATNAPVRIGKPKSYLTIRQRVLSGGFSLATLSLLGLDAVVGGPQWAGFGVALVAAIFAVVAFVGRAPDFLADMLAALSGDAP